MGEGQGQLGHDVYSPGGVEASLLLNNRGQSKRWLRPSWRGIDFLCSIIVYGVGARGLSLAFFMFVEALS